MIYGSFPFKKVLILKIIPINVFLHVILFLQCNTIFVIIFFIYIEYLQRHIPGSTAMLLKRCKNISEMLRKHFKKMFYLREFVWF